jgi:NTP pyrophosphatase (non-canonical NTP hydrolase)
MTRTEHLLCILAEECAEVAQRASKAMRFGMAEVEPGQPHTNAERVCHEMADLVAVFQMLTNGRLLTDSPLVAAKREKVERFLRYSAECGTVADG